MTFEKKSGLSVKSTDFLKVSTFEVVWTTSNDGNFWLADRQDKVISTLSAKSADFRKVIIFT